MPDTMSLFTFIANSQEVPIFLIEENLKIITS